MRLWGSIKKYFRAHWNSNTETWELDEPNEKDNVSSPFSKNCVVYIWDALITSLHQSSNQHLTVSLLSENGYTQNKRVRERANLINLHVKVYRPGTAATEDDLEVLLDKLNQWMEEHTRIAFCIERYKLPILYNENNQDDRLVILGPIDKITDMRITWK